MAALKKAHCFAFELLKYLLLLGCSLLCGLLGSFLLGLLHLLWFLNLDNPVASSSLSGSSGHLEGTRSNHPLQGDTDIDGWVGILHLVVGGDVLQDGGSGGAS